mmetsp:Transcript_14931/g.20503  ORF Transcript_14931/g.20503 Transcript_14931/m.20503 type:complete len:1670 (+) Transcript_14931:55-5064(+)
MSYYITNSDDDSRVLKGYDDVPYVSAYIAQGLRLNFYRVVCVASAMDVFGGKSNAVKNIAVYPIQSTFTTSSLTISIQAAQTAIKKSFIDRNPSAVLQVVHAAANSINIVDCTVPISCNILKRQECSTTPKTCGSCIAGFVGVLGHANTPCNVTTGLIPINGDCQTNSSCISGVCAGFACADANKACPNNCGGKGYCTYIDNNNQILTACPLTVSSCRATCKCSPGYFGRDCSLSSAQYAQLTAFRETMCSSLRNTLAIQNVNSDTVASRILAVNNMMIDPTQVSSFAAATCSEVLVTSITEHPTLACLSSTTSFNSTLNAVSNIAQLGCAVSSALLPNISGAVYSLSSSCRAQQAQGEAPLVGIAPNLRMLSQQGDVQALSGKSFRPPQSAFEAFMGLPSETILLNLSSTSGGTASLSLLQFTNNPRCVVTNSTDVQVKLGRNVTYAGLVNATRRSVVSNAAVSNALDDVVTVTLLNNKPIEYFSLASSIERVNCSRLLSYDLFKNVTCPNGLRLNLTCPAGHTGFHSIRCPRLQALPQCTLWDGVAYTISPHCQVVNHTATSTTCHCNPKKTFTTKYHRQLAASTTFTETVYDFASTSTIHTYDYSATFVSDPALIVVRRFTVLTATASSLLGILLAGLLGFGFWDSQEAEESRKKRRKLKEASSRNIRTIQGFFNSVVPEEFKPGMWKELLWDRMLLEHCWLSVLSPQDERKRSPRSLMWLLGICRLLTFAFFDSIVVAVLFADDGFCERFKTQASCDSPVSVANIVKACQWHTENTSCAFRRPAVNFVHLVLFTIFVTVGCAPVSALLETCIRRLRFSTIRDFAAKRHEIMAFFRKLLHRLPGVSPLDEPLFSSSGEIAEGDKPAVVRPGSAEGKEEADVTGGIRDDKPRLQEYWTLDDELKDCLTQSAKLLKAARLMKMQRQADFVLPSVEAEKLLMWAREELRSFGRSEFAVDRQMQLVFDGSETVKRARCRCRVASKAQLIELLTRARIAGDAIKQDLEAILGSHDDVERHLFQRFIVSLFTGFKRQVAARFMLKPTRTAQSAYWRFLELLAAVLILLAFAVGVLYVLFTFDRRLGSRAMDLWILVFVLSLLEDIFVIQPMKIWLVWIVIPSAGGLNREVFATCHALRTRFVAVMNRQAGCMRDTHAALQHLNPACRAARLFPQLPVARLLLSLNDYDVPRFAVPSGIGSDLTDVLHLGLRDAHRPATSASGMEVYEYVLEKARQVAVLAVVCVKSAGLLLLTSLPASVQDAALELLGGLLVNLLALSFYLLGRVVLPLAVVLAVLLLLFLYLKETTAWRHTELYRIARDAVPFMVRDLPVFTQRRKFDEASGDFDSRVLFKSSFSPVDSEITKVETAFERRRNKYSLPGARAKQPRPTPVAALSSSQLDSMASSSVQLKPSVVASKDVQRSVSLYSESRKDTDSLAGRDPVLLEVGPSSASLQQESLSASDIKASVLPVPTKERGRGRDRPKESKRERSRDRDESGEVSGRRKAASKSKRRLHRLSQEVAALQLEVQGQLGRDSDGEDSLASMSARSRQAEGGGAGAGGRVRRSRPDRANGTGPGEGGGSQHQLHLQLQQQIQQRAADSSSQQGSFLTGSGLGGMGDVELLGPGLSGPGFGSGHAASLRFSNSFDPLAASQQFQQQQQRPQNTRSQFPAWH